MAGNQDTIRAKKTLYVTGFDPRQTTKHLLEELFMQGGPVTDLKLFDTHAYVQFQDEESVSYCLALFTDLELHGRKLRVSAKHKSRDSLSHLRYLMKVRQALRDEYVKIPPPDLPPKKMPLNNQSPASHSRRASRHGDKNKTVSDQKASYSGSKSGHRRRIKKQSRSKTEIRIHRGRRRR